MPAAINLEGFENSGIRVIRLLDKRYISPKGYSIRQWLVLCKSCLQEFPILAHSIKKTKSCGCRGQAYKYKTHPLYSRFCKIIDRCENSSCPAYKDYGGRGVKICNKFREDFEFFVSRVGLPKHPQDTLDRPDNNKNYSCGECEECINNRWLFNLRWATKSQQASNRRTTKVVTINDKLMSMKEGCRFHGLKYKLVHQFIQRSNSSFEEAVSFYKRKIKPE